MGIINFTKPETGSFLVDIIFWLVQICSSVAVGIVLFTLLLKLITFPFDYASRASMRKNSVKMEEMRPELEKLQKQYADNKDLYNQKMMALYKKNGYSMFGACLPTILTLVIFIIAINAFTDYSHYQNKQYFYNMSLSYNEVVYAGIEDDIDGKYIKYSDGRLIVNENDIIKDDQNNDGVLEVKGKTFDNTEYDYSIFYQINEENKTFTLYTTNGYTQYQVAYTEVDGVKKFVSELKANYTAVADAEEKIIKNSDVLASPMNRNLLNSNGDDYSTAKLKIETADPTKTLTVEDFIKDIRQQRSAETFREENQSFLWVKNIWVTDSPMKNPVESSWDNFRNTYQYEGNQIGKDYNNLIAKLSYERSAPNGYLILVVLTAASSFFMQLVMGKAQKAQMELQTVDGQGAQTQKIMKWMMPIMMAFFAFMYTAAFSIYIVLSSLISMGTTFLINFIVDKKLKREKVKAGQVKETAVIRGRVYTPKEEEKPVEKKKEKKKKKDQFSHDSGEDFLSGKADKKKHVRGRMK